MKNLLKFLHVNLTWLKEVISKVLRSSLNLQNKSSGKFNSASKQIEETFKKGQAAADHRKRTKESKKGMKSLKLVKNKMI